jgi:hypothetical protein
MEGGIRNAEGGIFRFWIWDCFNQVFSFQIATSNT